MNRCELGKENHKKGYNCAQAVLCAFADKIGFNEDVLFRLSEAFGGGMGGTRGVCGAVSAMVFVAGALKSCGIDSLPSTNKFESYNFAGNLMEKFKNEVGTILCDEIKGKKLCSCDDCIVKAIKILEENI